VSFIFVASTMPLFIHKTALDDSYNQYLACSLLIDLTLKYNFHG